MKRPLGSSSKQRHGSKVSPGSMQASRQDLGVEDCFEACFEDAVDSSAQGASLRSGAETEFSW